MSRAPHDAITRALPGDDHVADRARARRAVGVLQALLPPGVALHIDSTGATLIDASSGLVTREEVERALDTLRCAYGRGVG